METKEQKIERLKKENKDFKEYIKAYTYNLLDITNLYIAVFIILFNGVLDFVGGKLNGDGLE